MVQSKHSIPKDLMVNGSHKPLFRFVADNIRDFLAENDVHVQRDAKTSEATMQVKCLELGFTFSFTYENESLSRGTMIQWDKGWDIPDALGRDPCEMLQTAIDDLDLPVHVSALVSDSVGTLMARSYTSKGKPNTLMGAIFGTGTNAAYVERLSNVTKLQTRPDFLDHQPESIIIINTEWGAFDEDMTVLPTTIYDDLLDKDSANRKSQMLEKRISGLYLGELLRLVMCSLMDAKLLDMTVDADSLLTKPYTMDSSFLTSLAQDESRSLDVSMGFVSDALRARNLTYKDTRAIQSIAVAIARRASRLAGAAIGAIIVQSGKLHPPNISSPSTSSSDAPKTTDTKEKVSDPARLSGLSKAWYFLDRHLCQLLSRLGQSLKTHSTPVSVLEPAIGHSNSDEVTVDIGVDGSLFEFYPTFEEGIRGALRDIPEIGPGGERRITMGLARDGSGVGAALVAQSIS
ncbi:hypothetical protein QQZ08_006109 [Neonectria magnoliae]|uniref:Phosphotransferase n=1 Tax=Neonectria magnoliae TaxID=2732573 RepID=A0ABR1I2W9_9HYPO